MKKLLLAAVCMVLAGCSTPHAGEFVGGPDRCMVGTDYGCHLFVKDGVTVSGVGVNLRMVDGEIGGGKPPSIENVM